MNEELNTSAEMSEVADPIINEQANEPTNEPVNAGSEEITPSQVDDKQVQTKEENSNFASMRRKLEQEFNVKQQQAVDAEYSRLYGESHNIHSKADYDNTIKVQEEENRQEELRGQGIDPEMFNRYIEENPTVKQSKAIIEQQNQQRHLSEQVKALEEYAPGIDLSKLDPTVVKEFESGKSLVDAYAKWENASLKAKIAEYEGKFKAQETNTSNANSSTGSVTGNGVGDSGFISSESFQANKGNQRWVMDNLNKIQESRVKW